MASEAAKRKVKWRRWVALFLLVAVVAVNGIAWMQAWAMTHYTDAGVRTPRPEEMSFAGKIEAVLTGVRVPRPRNDHTPADVGLHYETREMAVGRNGGMLEAWYVPADRPRGTVLMFTGYAESKESLLVQAATLHGIGYDALMFDFRGAGGSSGGDTTLGVREGEDVAVAAEYARETWPDRRLVLYGVSMGATAILRAIAHEGVRPDAVVLESPFDRLVSTVGKRFDAMGLPKFPAWELLVFWGSVQMGFDGFAHNPVEYAGSVQFPVLLLHGEKDPRVTVAQSRAIYDALGGYKEQAEFAGAGHDSLIASAPELWREKVEQFLRYMESK